MRTLRTFVKHRGDVRELREDAPLLVGRAAECDVLLDDDLASRRHCRLELVDDEPRVVDLGSRNGVLVNGLQIEKAQVIHHGDVITVGRSALTVSRQANPPRPTDSIQRLDVPLGRETLPGEHTTSGNIVDMLAGATRRSLDDGNDAEADRAARNLFTALRSRLSRGAAIADVTIDETVRLGLMLAERFRDPGWLDQLLDVFVAADRPANASTHGAIARLALDIGPPRRARDAYAEMAKRHGAPPL